MKNTKLHPDASAIRQHIERYAPFIHIWAKKPDSFNEGRYFGSDIDGAVAFVTDRNSGNFNCYFTFNVPTKDCGAKPSKSQIVAIRGLHVDIDAPKDGEPFDKVAVLAAVRADQPTSIVDSGGGIHAYWLFPEPIEVTPESVEAVEALNKALIAKFDGDRAAPNVDRLMRIPGTINWPDAKKRAQGRVPVLSSVMETDANAPRLSLAQLHERFGHHGPVTADSAARAERRSATGPVDAQANVEAPPCRFVTPDEALASLRGSPTLWRAYEGDISAYGNDDSRADQALVNALAARTGWNAALTEQLWIESPVGQRSKTRDNEGNYRGITIAKAFQDRPYWAYDFGEVLDHVRTFNASIDWMSPRARPRERFTPLTAADLKAQPTPKQRIKGVFPAEGFAAVYGASGSGKSFLCTAAAIAIAEGAEFFGHRTTKAPVLYVALEGAGGYRGRTIAWELHHGRNVPNDVGFILTPFHLIEPQDIAELAGLCPPGVVIFIDTLNRAAPGTDENSPKDMGAIIEGAMSLQRQTSGLVVLVAHTGKDATKGLRGHSSLFAALDAAVLVERVGQSRTWRVDKAKDGEDGLIHGFQLKSVSVGEDEDGEELTSAVVIGDEMPSPQISKPLSATRRLALETFHEVANTDGILGPGGEFLGIPLQPWRAAFYRKSPAENDEAKRKAFNRARTELVEQGMLAVENDAYRIAGQNAAISNAVIAATIAELRDCPRTLA